MICDNCIKKDVCVHLKNFLNLKFESNTVKLAIDECPHYYTRDDICSLGKCTLELPICEICGEKCYERYTCKECGKKVCIDCAAEYEINEVTQDVECICIECEDNNIPEKTEEEKLIDSLF